MFCEVIQRTGVASRLLFLWWFLSICITLFQRSESWKFPIQFSPTKVGWAGLFKKQSFVYATSSWNRYNLTSDRRLRLMGQYTWFLTQEAQFQPSTSNISIDFIIVQKVKMTQAPRYITVSCLLLCCKAYAMGVLLYF